MIIPFYGVPEKVMLVFSCIRKTNYVLLKIYPTYLKYLRNKFNDEYVFISYRDSNDCTFNYVRG